MFKINKSDSFLKLIYEIVFLHSGPELEINSCCVSEGERSNSFKFNGLWCETYFIIIGKQRQNK